MNGQPSPSGGLQPPISRQQQSLRDIHQAIVDLTAVVSKAFSGSDSEQLVDQVEALEAEIKSLTEQLAESREQTQSISTALNSSAVSLKDVLTKIGANTHV